MPARIPHKRPAEPDRGVSELIGAILMISVVIAAVALVGVILLSQSVPQKIPNINFMTGNDNKDTLYLYHNGGDSMEVGTFTVLVDGSPRNDFTIPDGSTEWSLGKNLVITGVPSASPHTVAIVYNTTGGGPVVIRSANSSIVVPATQIINPDVISLKYPPIVSVPQLMQNVTSHSVVYYRFKNAAISQSPYTYLKFTITQPNSTIFTTPVCSGSNLLELSVGDTVNITQIDSVSQGFRIAGIGSQIWELTADNVTLAVTTSAGTTRCSISGLVINHTMITGYNNFQSNFTIGTADPFGTYSTALTVYNYTTNTAPQLSSQLVNRLDANSTVITDISPTSSGFFVFQFDNTTRGIYFAGNTTKVTFADNQVYP
jgi:flagellin-like protein